MIPIVNVLQGWDRTPRALFVRNEVGVCVWECTPLVVPGRKSATTAHLIIHRISNLEGSVSQTQTRTSFLTSKARGVLHHKARAYYVAEEAS